MACECYAVLQEPARALLYKDAFPEGRVPLKGPNPKQREGKQGFYLTDVGKMSLDQKREFAKATAIKWNLPEKTVLETIDDPRHGIPILQEGSELHVCDFHDSKFYCTCGTTNYFTKDDLEVPIFCSYCGKFFSAPLRYFH